MSEKTEDQGGPDETIIESGADGWRSMHDLAVAYSGRGVGWLDKTETKLVNVRISRHEAELLCLYWMARKSWAEEPRLVYHQISTKEVFEATYASCRLAELEPHVSGPFLAEMRAEAKRRDAAAREAHDAYVASLERDAQANDPGDLG